MGGSGTWSSTLTNWTTAPRGTDTGTGSDVNDKWNTGFAIFNGAGSGTKTVTVASGDTISVKGLQFVTNNYVVAGADTLSKLTLVGDGTLDAPERTAITVDDGMSATVSVTLANAVSSTVGIRKLGTGTLLLTGANTYAGVTSLEAGTLALGSSGALGSSSSLTFNGGSLRIDSGANATSFSGSVVMTSAGTLDNGSRSFTLSGALSGPSTFTKTGPGTLTLSGNSSTYVGGLKISGGTVSVATANALGKGSGAGAKNTLTLDGGTLAGTDDIESGIALNVLATNGILSVDNGKMFSLTGVLSGTGTLTKQGSGTLVLTADNGGFAGGIAVNSGVLSAATGGALGTGTGTSRNTITLSGGTLRATDTFTTGVNVVAGASGATITVDTAKSLTLTGTLSGTGALTKSGAGTLALEGSNGEYNGGITVSQGTLSANSQAALGKDTGGVRNTITLNGGNMLATATFSTGVNILLAQEATIGAATNQTLTLSGSMTGSGKLNLTGKVNLSGDALTSYSGDLSVGGTVKVEAGSTIGSANKALDVTSGGTLGGNGTILSKVTVGSGATLSAGASPGTLTIKNDLALDALATTLMELGSPGYVGKSADSTIANDLVLVQKSAPGALDGNVTLGGKLQVSSGRANTAVTSGYYRLISYEGSLSGAFDETEIVSGGVGDTATVLTNIDKQINLLYSAGGQSVLFFTGSGNTIGHTGQTPGSTTPAGGVGSWSVVANDDTTTGFTQWTTAPTGSTAGAPASSPTSSTGSDINDGWRRGVAVFGGSAGGTVTVSATAGNVEVEGIQFITNNYTISGDALTLVGNTQGGSANTTFIRTEANVTATIESVLQGSTTAKGFDKAGGGTLILTGANTFTGAVTVSSGTLVVGNADALGSAGLGSVAAGNIVMLKGGTTLKSQGAADLTLRQSITLDGNASVDTNGKTLTLRGALAKTTTGDTLTKSGSGDLRLSGDSSGFGGIVQISQGSLTLAGTGNAATSAKLTVTSLTVGAGTKLKIESSATLHGTGNTITNNDDVETLGSLLDDAKIVNNGTLRASGTLYAPTVENNGTFTGDRHADGQVRFELDRHLHQRRRQGARCRHEHVHRHRHAGQQRHGLDDGRHAGRRHVPEQERRQPARHAERHDRDKHGHVQRHRRAGWRDGNVQQQRSAQCGYQQLHGHRHADQQRDGDAVGWRLGRHDVQ